MPGQTASSSQQFSNAPGQMLNQQALPVTGGMPGRPGMQIQSGPGTGPISSPMQQPPKRIDPDQMPNPVSSSGGYSCLSELLLIAELLHYLGGTHTRSKVANKVNSTVCSQVFALLWC